MKNRLLVLFLAWCTASCTGLGVSKKDRGAGLLPQGSTPSRCYTETGIASWYGKEFNRKRTAAGEVYDMYALSAAHKTLPLGTWVVVTDLDTHRSIHVRINDRGPFVKDRIIDLSYGAAKELGILEKGTARVEVRCSYSEETLRDRLGYWVQLAAYQDRALAGDLAGRLHEEYPNVQVFSSEEYHHVRIGPFQSEPEANRLKELLLARGQRAFVVRDLLPLSERCPKQNATQGVR